MARRTFEPLTGGGLEGRTRAMLKVEDGCVNFCTYCVIQMCIRDRYIDLTLDGVQQNISFDFSGVRTESTHISVETWAEAVAALNGAEYTNVTYAGAEDATLTSALTLRPEKHLSIREASLTIGSGGVLTLQGNADEAANVYLQKGNLTVADGGKLTTNSQSETQNRYYNASVSAEEGVAVADGLSLIHI